MVDAAKPPGETTKIRNAVTAALDERKDSAASWLVGWLGKNVGAMVMGLIAVGAVVWNLAQSTKAAETELATTKAAVTKVRVRIDTHESADGHPGMIREMRSLAKTVEKLDTDMDKLRDNLERGQTDILFELRRLQGPPPR